MKEYLEAGEFVTTHGVQGELKLYPWSDTPDFLTGFSMLYFGPKGQNPTKIRQARPHKNTCLVQLEGVDSIEAARAYIGRTVWIARAEAQLPTGRWFVQDMLGCTLRDADTGAEYGTVVGITHPGAHDVYEVEDAAGMHHLFPAAGPFVEEIRPEEGWISVRPIPGMFDDEAAAAPKGTPAQKLKARRNKK